MPRPRGPLTVLLLRLGAVAAVLFLQRVLFFLLNRDAFPSPPLSAFLGGMRFDGSVIGWLWLPWLALFLVHPFPATWFRRLQQGVFLAVAAVAFFFNSVDMEYYKFTLKRSTADLFDIMGAGGDVVRLAPVFVRDYWYIVLVFAASMAFVWWAYGRTGSLLARPMRTWSWRIGWRAIALVGMFLLGRGGVQYIPLGILHAGNYAPPAYFPVVLNSPFTIMTSLGKPVLEERVYMEQDRADLLWPVAHHFADTLNTVAPGANVVLIVLESFSAEYSGVLGGGQGHMPFLDSLMGHGINCTRAFANGRRSIDAIPAITASIPELMDEAFLTSPYAEAPFTSLPGLLRERGYHTLFLHGGNNGTMGFDVFARAAGFTEYLGRDEYDGPEEDVGVWGVRDEPYLRYAAGQLEQRPGPFMACLFTLSSHHPYQLPPADAERFATDGAPILATLRYTDHALRGFFERAQLEPWYANTLFVITADHTADLERDGKVNSSARDYWVPLLYFMPGRLAPSVHGKLTQHIDIVPTVLDLLGYDRPFFSLGHSALRPASPPYAVTARNQVYLMIGEQRELYFDGEKPLLFQPVQRPAPGPMVVPEALVARDMQDRLQAAIQQFTSRIVQRRMVVEPEAP